MEIRNNETQYKVFKERRQELATLLGDASREISKLNMDKHRDNLKELSDKVHNETFKIQVIGTFKNGKSTFINSFLGEEILPAYALPCTAVINEIKYGAEKRAVLYFKDPLPDTLPLEISEKAVKHMKAHGMKRVPPMDIPYQEIEDYVVIPIGKEPKDMLLESPYEKVELFWPLELLKNGVEIVDSPGLNEHRTRTTVTVDYIAKADAVLFVLNAQQICSAEEMNFIERYIARQGFTDPFFIVNRFDCIRERERPAMKQFVNIKLGEYTSNEIFFVSALNALDAKIDGDKPKLLASGMPGFENRLTEFLTRQRGNAKLAQPARELKRILNEEALFKTLPAQRQMLGTSLDELKLRYENAKPKLAELVRRKDQMCAKLELRTEQCKPTFRRMSHSNTADLAAEITAWLNAYEPEAKLGAIPSKAKANEVVKEISAYISDKVEEHQLNWRANALMPMIQEKAQDIFGAVEEDIQKLFADIDSVTVDLSGREYEHKSVPAWQRVAGVVGGLAIGDVGLAASGGINGLSVELAKTAAFEIGAGMLLGVLGLLNLVTIIAVIVGAFVMNWTKGKSNAMQKLKRSITDELIGQLNESAEATAEALVASISDKFAHMTKLIVSALDIEICETERQTQAIIAEIERGTENVTAKLAALSECEKQIQRISTALDQLIFKIVEE